MTFFSRPDLSDIQFKQLIESELHLSGVTYFVKPGGIEIAIDSSGNTVPIIATGATSGDVLTYIDGKIKLSPSGGASDVLFDSCRPTSRVGVPNIDVGGETVKEFLEGYFFPSVVPTSSLSASLSSREFGDGDVGTLSFTITRQTNPLNAASVDTTGDGTLNQSIISSEVAGSCSGSYPYTFPSSCPSPPIGTSQTSVGYGLCASTTASEVTCSSTNLTWRNRRFYFLNSTLYSASDESTLQTIARGLTGSQAALATSKSANLSLTFNNQFFYYMYPKSFGTPTFAVNGLPNNAWGNSATGTLFEVTYINNNGYSNEYYVARSDNRITGSFTIAIS